MATDVVMALGCHRKTKPGAPKFGRDADPPYTEQFAVQARQLSSAWKLNDMDTVMKPVANIGVLGLT
jgi:hypothetical protein